MRATDQGFIIKHPTIRCVKKQQIGLCVMLTSFTRASYAHLVQKMVAGPGRDRMSAIEDKTKLF